MPEIAERPRAIGHGLPNGRLANGLDCQWYMNGRIVAFTLRRPERDAVDAWIAAMRACLDACPEDEPFLVLHDFTEGNIILTPYARQRIAELVAYRDDKAGYAAIILPRGPLSTIGAMFMRREQKEVRIKRTFFDRDEGLKWLASKFTAPEG